MEPSNYVAELNEYSQKTRAQLIYKDVDASGPDHDRTFSIRVELNGADYPEGVGKSRKEAKHSAAKNALKRLLETEGATDASTGAASSSLLSKRGHKNRAAVESSTGSENSFINKVRRLNMNCQSSSVAETNFTGLVNQYCQERNLNGAFAEAGRSGPSHNPQFFYRLVIGNKEYPIGDGKNKKEAKQRAAQLAWSALQQTSDRDSEMSSLSTSCEDSASTSKSSCSESSPHDQPMSSSDSVVFRHSSNHPADQMSRGPSRGSATPPSARSPKPHKQRANATSEFVTSKDPAKKQEPGVRKTQTQSRFTAEFDSIEHLGKGGFGFVYKAREKLMNMYYAVKIVTYDAKALREAKALSDLSHHNIVRYYNCWKEDSHYEKETGSVTSESVSASSSQYLYIKMQLCDTKTLRHWIRRRNERNEQVPKRKEDSLKIAQQVVLGVEYVHSKDLIHRDLKPENIMFGLDKAVKIGDFGLVTAEKCAEDGRQLKRTRAGTRSYMAPEQKDHPDYNHKVDIFALGLIFFELLWKMSTGHEKVLTWDNVRCQKFPEPFRESFFQEAEIIKQMLSERPENRPEASSVKAELEKWTQQHLRNVTV